MIGDAIYFVFDCVFSLIRCVLDGLPGLSLLTAVNTDYNNLRQRGIIFFLYSFLFLRYLLLQPASHLQSWRIGHSGLQERKRWLLLLRRCCLWLHIKSIYIAQKSPMNACMYLYACTYVGHCATSAFGNYLWAPKPPSPDYTFFLRSGWWHWCYKLPVLEKWPLESARKAFWMWVYSNNKYM